MKKEYKEIRDRSAEEYAKIGEGVTLNGEKYTDYDKGKLEGFKKGFDLAIKLKDKNTERFPSPVIEYRKRVTYDTEEYCAINTTPVHGPSNKWFAIRTLPCPEFLATHTYKIFGEAFLIQFFNPQDMDGILNCDGGWEKIEKNEYDQVLDQVLGSMKR